MKKILTLVLLNFFIFLSSGATEKKLYLIMPGNITIDKAKYTGSDNTGRIEKSNTYLIYGMVSEGKLEKMEVEKVKDYNEGAAQLVEVVVGTSEEDAQVKLAMSYKAEDNRYVILADEGAKGSTITEMKTVYNEGSSFSPETLLTTTSSGSRYSYGDFPGYEIKEDVRVFNSVVGEKKIGESTVHSNIIEKLIKTSGGSAGVTGDKVNINPANSKKNRLEMKDIYGKALDINDYKTLRKEGNSNIYFDRLVEEMKFRVKTKSVTTEVKGLERTFNKNKIYELKKGDGWFKKDPEDHIGRVVIVNEGGNGKWYAIFNEENTSFHPQEVEPDSFYIKKEDGQYLMFDENAPGQLREVTLKEDPKAEKKYIPEVDEWGKILDYLNENPDESISEGTWYTFFDGLIQEVRFNYDYDEEYLSIEHLPEGSLKLIDSGQYMYVFNSPQRMVLKGRRKDNSYFDEAGEWWNISFPEDNQEVAFIIAGVGDILEADVSMTSVHEAFRKRDSYIEFKLLEGDKNMRIKSISE